MSKKYKAIFFDWDGTAVMSRQAPVEEAVAAMKPLLASGVKLVIVSGTTYDKIASGKIHEHFTPEEASNLYLGLGRGAYNYKMVNGQPEIFADCIPYTEGLLKIHDVCYKIHRELLEKYNFKTDVVFSRPNYCKIDLQVENERGDQLFMQEDEMSQLKAMLEEHGLENGIMDLVSLSEKVGEEFGLKVSATCDAKYLEVGISCKSDNVDTILESFKDEGIEAEDCSFWGDEFVGIQEGLYGSDSFMLTPKTEAGDFFDVSSLEGVRPEKIQILGGGVDRFIQFLVDQSK